MSTHAPAYPHSTGIPLPKDACVVVVSTDWNRNVVELLEQGCMEELRAQNITGVPLRVPGTFELPHAIKSYWDNHSHPRPLAFIALGCVIRGSTPHFDYVCQGVTQGIMQLNLMLPVPSIFGVLTVDHLEQALERTGGAHGHKGREAAWAALQMIERFNPPPSP